MAYVREKARQKRQGASPRRLVVALASLGLAVFAVVFSYNVYYSESVFLDLDVNPSIELTLNPFDRVIGVYAYNEDGQSVLDEVDLLNRPYEDALAELVGVMDKLGYLEDSGLFTLTMQANDGEADAERLDALRALIGSLLQAGGRSTEQEVFSVDAATKLHAHGENLTPAKYLAILALQEIDPTVTFDNCRNHSIAEIEQQAHGQHGVEEHDEEGVLAEEAHDVEAQDAGTHGEGGQGEGGHDAGGRDEEVHEAGGMDMPMRGGHDGHGERENAHAHG
jgi:hypothetical protein